MENFEKSRITRGELIDDITYEACAMPEFKKIVAEVKDVPEAIAGIREMLRERFPQISQIPEPKQDGKTHPSNEFVIAKNIFELLKLTAER
jgi:hypothetical protein